MKLWHKNMLYNLCMLSMIPSFSMNDTGNPLKGNSLGKTTEYLSIAQSLASISLASITAYCVYHAYSKDTKKAQPSHYVTNASLKSWAGEVPQEIKKVIEYIQNPEIRRRYGEFNVRPYKGILFHGPPGTGKTALARAIAGETHVPFFTPKPSDILSQWIGESERNIAQLFRDAREAAQNNCAGIAIIFLDEFEFIAKKRGEKNDHVPIQQLLIELDGFDRSAGVLVIASTNKLGILDEGVIREGRFDSKIEIGYPDSKKQREILSICLEQTKYEHNGDEKQKQETIERVVQRLVSCKATAAMIAALVDNAARRAVHDNMRHITDTILLEEAEKISRQRYS